VNFISITKIAVLESMEYMLSETLHRPMGSGTGGEIRFCL